MSGIRVILADDQVLFRESLGAILELRSPEIEIVAQAANGEEALQLARKLQPDIILMDVRMPVMDGVESARHVLAECPAIKIIMLTTFDDDEYVLEALRLGALGYLLKDIPPEEVVAAIVFVHNGGVLMSPQVAARIIGRLVAMQGDECRDKTRSATREILTPREYDILRQIGLGKDNREIAALLYLTEGTVRNHVSSIYAKLNLRDRAQAVKYAMEHGVL